MDNEIEALFDNEQAGRRAAERFRENYDRRRGVVEESEEVKACSFTTGQVNLLVMAIYVIVRDNWKKLFQNDYHFLVTLARMSHESGDQALPRIAAFWPLIKNRLGDERILPIGDLDSQIALVGSIAWIITRASVEHRPSRSALQRGIYDQIQEELTASKQEPLEPMGERSGDELPEEFLQATAEVADQLEHERIAQILALRTSKLGQASAAPDTPLDDPHKVTVAG